MAKELAGSERLNLRRLRLSPHLRQLSREVRLSVEQFIQPLFYVAGIKERQAVPGLQDVYRETAETLVRQVEADLEKGVNKFLLFGVPASKRERGFEYDELCRFISLLKGKFGNSIWLATDVCLCSHTSHGHCGMLSQEGDRIANSESIAELARQAALFAQAGADCLAPSDMLDGRIKAIRERLAAANLDHKTVMSYAAKFHSRFYGPFRLAAESAPKGELKLKDRASYQIDPARPADALLAARRDAAEGADILMVKPGLAYLDILQDLSRAVELPWAVYQVSGEYAAIELLAKEQLIDRASAFLETWTAFVRAGAQIIISYGARHSRQWIGESRD